MEKKGAITDEQVLLDGLLLEYVQIIEATRRGLERVPKEVLPRVGWDQVVNMAEKFAAEATSVGIVWHGDVSNIKPLTDNMEEFFGLLQRVIMLGHGATRDAGITLAACMRNAVDNLLDASMNLMKEAVFSYDCEKERNGDTIPKLIGLLWDAWIALGKIPINNVTAVGEALAQVAVSVKEKLRKMEELKEASAGAKDAVSGDAGSSIKQQKEDSVNQPEKIKDEIAGEAGSSTEEQKKGSCDPAEEIKDGVSGDERRGSKEQKEAASVPSDNIGLSSEEKTIARLTTDAVSEILELVNQHGPEVIGLINKERESATADFVDSLGNIVEKMLKKVLKEAPCVPSEESQDKLSGEAESSSIEPEKAENEPLEDAEAKPSVEAVSIIIKTKVSDLSPEDQMAIAQLTTDAVSGIAELLNQLGLAVLTLLDKEREGTVEGFVDSVESVLKISKEDIESQIETLFDPEDFIARRIAFTRVSRALRELAVIMHQQLKGSRYSREFGNAWTKCVQVMKQLAAEFSKHNPAPAVERQQP